MAFAWCWHYLVSPCKVPLISPPVELQKKKTHVIVQHLLKFGGWRLGTGSSIWWSPFKKSHPKPKGFPSSQLVYSIFKWGKTTQRRKVWLQGMVKRHHIYLFLPSLSPSFYPQTILWGNLGWVWLASGKPVSFHDMTGDSNLGLLDSCPILLATITTLTLWSGSVQRLNGRLRAWSERPDVVVQGWP